MPTRRLLIGTKNPKKLAEMQALLAGLDLRVFSVDEARPDLPSPEETGETFDDNARLKALYFAQACGAICVADDSGLEVDHLGGAPGVHSSRYAGRDGDDQANNAKLLEELRGVPPERRGARFRCVLALAVPGEVVLTAAGAVEGRILEEPRGDGGFGYDPLFYYPEWDLTFGEVDRERKAGVSHRGRAMRVLADRLPAALRIIAHRREF